MKTDNDKMNDCLKGRKIAEDLSEIMQSSDNLLNKNDYPEVEEWIATDPSALDVVDKLCDSQRLKEANRLFHKEEKETDVASLIAAIDRKQRVVRRIKLTKIAVTSIASVMFFSLFVYYNSIERQSTTGQILTQVTSNPKSNHTYEKPTLILNNGQNLELPLNDESNEVDYLASSEIVPAKNLKNIYNTLVIPKQFTYSIKLSDGTVVYLNANSELKYPTKFDGEKREVYLKGEAYFDVQKGEKPFVVFVENVAVKVYGTKFNINAYDCLSIKTALVEGSVGVTVLKEDHQKGGETMIKPNQMLSVTNNQKVAVVNVDASVYTSWLNGEIRSQNEPLSDLLNKISKWYGVDFVYGEQARTVNITTSLNNTLPLEKILEGIEMITDLKIKEQKENEYIIL